ncbi:hypothetical protein ACH5WX_03895, partial [Nocardioides sp. CER28]
MDQPQNPSDRRWFRRSGPDASTPAQQPAASPSGVPPKRPDQQPPAVPSGPSAQTLADLEARARD